MLLSFLCRCVPRANLMIPETLVVWYEGICVMSLERAVMMMVERWKWYCGMPST